MKTYLLICICAILFPFAGWAQHTVTGTVTDANTSEPLIGVSISVEGTTAGTITDLDGKYSISVASNASLQFSYIGYVVQKVPVNNQTQLHVALRTDDHQLEEFVVVGYAVQKKRDVLGAVSKINNEDLIKLPVSTPEQALQGRMAGVQVTNATGAPGAGVSVRVRGVSSIFGGKEPVYIVDGVAVEGGINAISPNDIESISILKDGAYAAIYGSRATNGIVLVTTKQGKKGEAKVNYNGQYGIQTVARVPEMVNTADYISIYNEAARTDNAVSVVKRPLIEGDYLKEFADVNYLDEIFQTAPIQSHEISITGGNDKTTYLISGLYFDQDGIILNSGYNKASIRSNISSDVKQWLTVGMNLSGSMSETRSIPSSGDGYGNSEGGSVVRYAFFRNPATPVYGTDGKYTDKPGEYFGDPMYDTFFGDGYNPVGWTNNTDRTRKEKTFLGTGNFIIKLPLNLSLKTVFGMDYKNRTFRSYNETWGTDNRINNPNSLNLENYSHLNWTANSVLNYNTLIAEKHTITALLGTEANRNSAEYLNNFDQMFQNKDFAYIGNGQGKKVASQGETASSMLSFFTTVNYNFDQKYYFTGLVRRDGSSKFYGDNKWGTFYSASAGWNMESESFMKDIKAIDKLKLRVGWGVLGNQDIKPYAYSDIYRPNYNYPFGGIPNPGYAESEMGNEDIQWETSNQFDAGIDMAFLNNSLGFTIDYFHKISENMLMLAPYPPSIGYTVPPYINNGSVLNTGVDLEIFFRKNYKEKGFNIALNAGYLKNEVTEMEAPIQGGRVDNGSYITLTEKGYPIGSFYMLEMAGIFQNETEILTSAFQENGVKPGDVKYVNQDNNNVIDANDRVHVGSAIPKFAGGLNLSGYWKNFDASCFFQGAFGHKIYSQIGYDIEGFYRGFPVTQRYFDNHWTEEGSTNTYPRASWSAKSNNVRGSTRFLEDGSYLRLKNLQIGYSIPNTKKVGIEKLRVYIAGTNLLTFSIYSGFDPEMTVSANAAAEGDIAAGIDWGTYPVARTFTMGVNLTF